MEATKMSLYPCLLFLLLLSRSSSTPALSFSFVFILLSLGKKKATIMYLLIKVGYPVLITLPLGCAVMKVIEMSIF